MLGETFVKVGLAALKGGILPFGGVHAHKGYGLSFSVQAMGLLAGVALVNITPENPYQNTPAFLFASQQTHLSSFSNIVRVLSQLWPFATIALLCVLGRHAGPPLQTENAA